MTWCSGSLGGSSDVNDLRLCLQVRNAQKAGATGAIIAGQ